MLAAYLGILLLPEKNDALPVVQDFLKCAQDLLLDKPVAATTEKALNVLLEILLSLLSKQSNLTRDLVGLVFGSFCEMLNKGMLDSLCRVLGIRDWAAGDADDGD